MKATTYNFTDREQRFANTFMKDFDKNSVIYGDMLRKFLVKELEEIQVQPGRGTKQAVEMIESILFKLAMPEADAFLEELLSDPTVSTKRKSLELTRRFTMASTHQIILDTLSNEGDLSRSDLAARTNLRIQSVCARTRELLNEGLIQISGTKYDSESRREVEVLKVVK